MRRFLMAMVVYGVALLATPLLVRFGMAGTQDFHWVPFVGLAVLINLAFFLLFRFDINLRFRDPSLTQAQILISACWGMLPLFELPAARPVILMFYIPSFSFGMLRLNRRQYYASALTVLILYAALLASEYGFERPGFRLSQELFLFAIFATLLGWAAFFGGFAFDQRRELGRQRWAIQQAHDQLSAEMTERGRVAADNERLIGELQQSLTQVRRLSGLLPICASCKKVRDDTGYWSQIEVYVRSHSEAEFTHGICPDCSKRLYGR